MKPLHAHFGFGRLAAVVGVAGLLGLGGCQAGGGAREGWGGPVEQGTAGSGALVLDAPGQARLTGVPGAAGTAGGGGGEVVPWYAYRRDVSGPVVVDGLRATVYEQSVTYSADHQTQSNGRVHDYTRTSTYRWRVERTVR